LKELVDLIHCTVVVSFKIPWLGHRWPCQASF